MILDWYKGKRVFVTGHTGFKGSWLVRMLMEAEAEVYGYALGAPTEPSLYKLTNTGNSIRECIADIRNYERLEGAMKEFRPEIVLHLAAQPIVRESYRIPRETFEVNVMGTVNVLEAARHTDSVRSIVNVTTDKVYLNKEEQRGYSEDDPLDGYDPYSNSKSCSDLVTHSYRSSFFNEAGVSVSTARAGNVIGGGDFAKDRIIPDCVRAAIAGEDVVLRNPSSVRPFQHVLEPLAAYLTIAAKQEEDPSVSGAYNVGPNASDTVTTSELVGIFAEYWGNGFSFSVKHDGGPHEAGLLMLDSTKIAEVLGFEPRWGIREAVKKTVEWSKVYADGGDVCACMSEQIADYFGK